MMKKMMALVVALMLAVGAVGALAETEDTQSGWWNILLLGGDSRSTQAYERTDSIVILSINQEEAQVKMSSIMRDIWVEFPGTGISHKINAANVFGGPELAMATVNEYFGTDIEDYVLINMTDMIEIIDMVGGIDLEITESERNYINYYAQVYIRETQNYDGETSIDESGQVHLNGLLAMSYTRNRYTDSDYGRVQRQQKVLLALAQRFQDMEVNDLMAMAEDISERVETNLDSAELETLARTGLIVELDEVGQYRVPADGTFSSGTYDGVWMIRPDFEENAELLHNFIYGEE